MDHDKDHEKERGRSDGASGQRMRSEPARGAEEEGEWRGGGGADRGSEPSTSAAAKQPKRILSGAVTRHHMRAVLFSVLQPPQRFRPFHKPARCACSFIGSNVVPRIIDHLLLFFESLATDTVLFLAVNLSKLVV